MKEKTKKNILFIIAFVTPINFFFGVFGSCYGYLNNRTLKEIQKRANSPFFEVSALLIDTHYDYRKEPVDLKAPLAERSLIDDTNIPDDYPDNSPLGLLLENTGSELRSFDIQPKEGIVLQKSSHLDPKLYELRYIYNNATKGEKFTFTITYETSEGFQDEQVWEIKKGMTSIKRIKPKIP